MEQEDEKSIREYESNRINLLNALEKRSHKSVEHIKEERESQKDLYRYNYAKWILWVFAGMCVLIILAVFCYNMFVVIPLYTEEKSDNILNNLWQLDNLLFMVISTFGTIIGFVIGYYFKESNKE